MFYDTLKQPMCWQALNHGEIRMRAILPNCFIFVGATELESIPLGKVWNLRMLVKTLTADGKYSCYKREKFRQAVQMQLSKKPKIFY